MMDSKENNDFLKYLCYDYIVEVLLLMDRSVLCYEETIRHKEHCNYCPR